MKLRICVFCHAGIQKLGWLLKIPNPSWSLMTHFTLCFVSFFFAPVPSSGLAPLGFEMMVCKLSSRA